MREELRRLPSVQTLLESPPAEGLIQTFGRDPVVDAIREKLDEARALLLANAAMPKSMQSEHEFWQGISIDLSAARIATLKPVINATGIIIHTNLGRAPLAPEAILAMQEVAQSYSTLEYDLETAARGSRHRHAERLICELTGAEAAMVVNNCAGAILTTLSALASGSEVVASRGEMVEIGGSFRMPDVIAQSGARLKEVGTTNKTHLEDYERAITNETALLLKSHTSNYKIVGFTSAPHRRDLSDLARQKNIHFVEDLGSGVLVDLAPYGLPDEPVVKDVLASGVDVVTFSGDKLLGGPQAGIIAGRKSLIERIKKTPMARAVRIDKLSLAALISTLDLYRAPHNPIEKIPVLQRLAEPQDAVEQRARYLASIIDAKPGMNAETTPTVARAGGGSLPQQDLPSFAVVLDHQSLSANAIAERLRETDVPVIGRISDDQFLLDLRSVSPADLETLKTSFEHAFPA